MNGQEGGVNTTMTIEKYVHASGNYMYFVQIKDDDTVARFIVNENELSAMGWVIDKAKG